MTVTHRAGLDRRNIRGTESSVVLRAGNVAGLAVRRGGRTARLLAPHLHQLHHDAELAIEISPRRLRKLGRCVDDVLDPLLACGFHPYLLANDYQAHSYPDAMRQPNPPVRLHPPYEGLKDPSDLVLSRTDVDYLP